MYEQGTVHILYKRLLTLYPRGFRDELEESMVQTFNDLYQEKRQTKKAWFGFVFWMFIETTIGIIHEHLLVLTQGDPMKNNLTNLRSPALISLLFVIPFIIMETVNTQNLNAIFNVPLFGIMWLLSMLFILTAMPIVQNLWRTGNSIVASPIILMIRVVFLALLVWMWFSILIDQMPCFLGVPNCD